MMTTNAAWLSLLNHLITSGSKVSPRGQPCLEHLGYSSYVPMNLPVLTVRERKLGRRFMVAECEWILSGRNDVVSMRPYSEAIANFSDDGVRFDGAYGVKIADQLHYVCDSLIADIDSRQAVIGIWRENPRPSRDIPCTISCQFLVRNGKLNCVDYMRSSDAWLGIPYDWFNFSMLSTFVLLELRSRDQRFMEVELGILQLVAGSQHLYERDLEAAKRVLESNTEDRYAPIDLSDFDSTQEFVEHLRLIKDRKYSGHRWLRELLPPKSLDELVLHSEVLTK